MLFDLEDYKNSGIIGTASMPSNQIYWPDAYTTFRATRDAYKKTVREYYESVLRLSTIAEFPIIEEKRLDFEDASMALGPIAKTFWNAMLSLPLAGQLIEGDRFDITSVGKYDENESHLSYPSGSAQNTWWNENYKNVAIANAEGEFIYTEMGQVIYDDYKLSLIDFQSKAQEIMIIGEGGVALSGYVPPILEAWDSYPQLSGYVRGTNNLSIIDAVVRLVDLDGVNHDVVTDENGFYKFSKEMFYNSIAFDHTAPLSTFNMFLLEHTLGSTASLYDPTNPFQNSFFGAENDKGLTWPMSVKMDRSPRRNFKLEFLPDYSSYPSFSGYVKDAAGIPIKDAFVEIKDGYSGYCIGQYKKSNGEIAMSFKYNDFGVDRTILTDENGFYEYTSQMVGEWFNKQLMQVGEVPGNLGGRIFDEYFGSREDLISFYDSYTQRNLQYKESFFPLLIPYKQDVNSNSIVWEGVQLYDNNEYHASRFKYALTSYNELHYQRIDLDAHYDIDVNISVAVGDEVRANKFMVELERESISYDQSMYCITTSDGNYSKIVYPATGESYLFSGYYNSSSYLSINYNNIDDYKDFYVYSCDSSGKAMGYIVDLQPYFPAKAIDLSGLKYLNNFGINGYFYTESIDFSELDNLVSLYINTETSLKNIIGLDSKKLTQLGLMKSDLLESIDISGLTNLSQLTLIKLPSLVSLDIQNNTKLTYINILNVDIKLDVSGLTNLTNVNFDKLTMTSDDVDDLLIQLADSGLVSDYGELTIPRISRSSYSDDAFGLLTNGSEYASKAWNINLGSYFYDEEIIPSKLVLTADPAQAIGGEVFPMQIPGIVTTTGYWIGKLWTGELIGSVPFVSNSMNYRLALGRTVDAKVEIYSCNEYGVPQGEITGISIDNSLFKNVDTSELTALEAFQINSSFGDLESLDFTSNYNLRQIIITNANNLQSIDVTGLAYFVHLELTEITNLVELTGFSTLSSLENLRINTLPNLPYLSLAGFNNIRMVEINKIDLYESANVDTMLSELNANSAVGLVALDAEIVVKQAELDSKAAESDLAYVEYQRLHSVFASIGEQISILDTERTQLINDGADQSLIDAKLAEIEAKQVEQNDAFTARIEFQNTVYAVLQEEVSNLTDTLAELVQQQSGYGSGKQVNTNYMARTSASDADYDSLIAYGWSLYLGEEFVGPYTLPVKGFVTYDWTPVQDSQSSIYFSNQSLRISSTTGFIKYTSGIFSGMHGVSTDRNLTDLNGSVSKGVLEFYSCDSHGRPAGSIIGFGHTYNYASYMKSFDISNLTEIKTIYFQNSPMMSSIDLSSNINIESITITDANLQSIVGFANLVNLKDIYMSSVSSLDLPVDFTPMPNLQRIYLYDLGINKNSRLNVSGLTRLQTINVNWTNLLSVDLDNALFALDAAGLNSESDFNYEGHLDYVSGLGIQFGMGIGFHAEYAETSTMLQSKGWSISVGDQIIDSVEEPTKGIARWSADSSWSAIAFSLENGGSVMAKYPTGIVNVGTMISYNFDSNVPVEGRFIEFWAVDSYGRPRHDCITAINDYWNTRITSLELDNIKSSITNIYIGAGHAIQSMDLTGFSNLIDFNAGNSSTLESVIFDGCSKIRNINLNESPNLNIDAVLESIDSTGSEADFNIWGPNYLYANKSIGTSVSEAFLDSLVSKGWELYLIEAPSAPVILNVVSGDSINFDISSSTGTIKLIFPEGSSMQQQYPDGLAQGSQAFRGINNFGYANYAFSVDFTGPISIISVAQNQNDGSYFNSGKVRYIRNTGQGTFDVNTMASLKSISLDNPTSATIAAIANLNLSLLSIDSYSGNSLDLSNHLSKAIRINQTAASILFNNSVLNMLNLNSCTSIDSIDLTGAIMTEVVITDCQSFANIELPTDLSRLYVYNCPLLTGVLDLTGCTSLYNLQLDTTSISSIDITGLSNIYSISLNETNCDIIGFETTSSKTFTHDHVDKNNYELALPATLESLNIASKSIQSLILTQSGIFKTNTQLSINEVNAQYGNDPISSIVLPIDKYLYIYLYGLSVLPDLSIMDSRTNLNLSNLSVTSIDLQGLSANEVGISGGTYQSINLGGTIYSLRLVNGVSYTSMDFSNLISNYIMTQNISLHGGILTRPDQYFSIEGGNNIDLAGSTFGNLDMRCTGVINLSGITANHVNMTYCYSVTSINLDGSNLNKLTVRYVNYENGMPTFQMSMVSSVILDKFILDVTKCSSIDATGASILNGSITYNSYLTNFKYSLKGSSVLDMTLNTAYARVGNSWVETQPTINLTDADLNTLLDRVEIIAPGVTLGANVVNSVINSISTSSLTGKTLRLRNMNSRTSVSQTAYTKLINQSWNMIAS